MAMARECDKCGKLYKGTEKIGHEVMLKIDFYGEEQDPETKFYDLCPECVGTLEKWFNESVKATKK